MPKAETVMLWPREEDYARFVAACTDRPPATYAEFVARAQPYLDALRAQGVQVRIVEPDVERMEAWCIARYGHVDTKARAHFAAAVGLGEVADKGDLQ